MAGIAADSAVLADHIELMICAHPDTNFNARRIEEEVSRHWDADPVEFRWAMSVLRDRSEILGDKYPLKVSHASVVKERETPEYETLLGLTRTNWYYSSGELEGLDTTKLFENVVEDCLSNFFGLGTSSVNFGWPSDVGRPMEFPPAVTWLANQIGIPVGAAYRQPRRKDGGVDIVVWRHFADRRPGVPLLLVQATVQTDIVSKSRDVDRRLWAGWLATDIEPLVALAIPGSFNSAETWNEISRNSLMLDRIRLVGLSPGLSEAGLSRCEVVIDASRRQTLEFLERE